ncbi:MAG: GNAT family N-acetyltransferase [Mycobacterium leprae]
MVVVKPCAPEQETQLFHLLNDARRGDSLGLYTEAEWHDWWTDPNGRGHWMAFREERPAGYMGMLLLKEFDGTSGAYCQVTVHPRERRQGVGSRLVAEAIHQARELGVSYLACCVDRKQQAVLEPFLCRWGFTAVRRTWVMLLPRDARLPEVRVPAEYRLRTLRAGDSADLAVLTDLENRVLAGGFGVTPCTVEEMNWVVGREAFRPDGCFILEGADGPVGFCRTLLTPDVGEVELLGVLPEYRRQGLGRLLLVQGARFLREHGASTIRLAVDGQNESALGLYRHTGFVPRSSRVHYRHYF